MDWRIKAIAFHVLDRLPGTALHRWLQQKVTGRYFPKISEEMVENYEFHIRNFRGGVALEFGAGAALVTPLLLSQAGADKVIAIDLTAHANVERVNHAIDALSKLRPGNWPKLTTLSDLTRYRIEYRAPADARRTGLSDASVDFVYSTSTLEHIPGSDIRAILTECRRILKPDGVMSFIIDYHDHYATFDSSITRWNFYRFTDRKWRKWNPSGHYQNRLRHSDFVQMFKNCGFHVEDSRRHKRAEDLDMVPICSEFAPYTRHDLTTSNGYFVLLHHSPSPRDSEE
jgi:SAM-dependent methyltransferase